MILLTSAEESTERGVVGEDKFVRGVVGELLVTRVFDHTEQCRVRNANTDVKAINANSVEALGFANTDVDAMNAKTVEALRFANTDVNATIPRAFRPVGMPSQDSCNLLE